MTPAPDHDSTPDSTPDPAPDPAHVHAYAAVLSGLAANPALPPELVDRLIEVAVADVDFVDELAERADLSREQALALFARVPDSGVRLARAGRLIAADVDPVAEPDTALALLDEGRGEPEWARALVADPCFLRRERLAACKGLPLDVAETLAADPDVRVVDELALCTTSPEIAARLAAHPHAQVRRALAWNETVPPAVLVTLLAGEGHDDPPPDTDTSVDDPYEITALHIQHAALRNPSTPTEAAVAFADHPSPMLRQALAQRPDLPPELGRRLAADPVPCVRADLAENPATTDDALMRVLAEDEDPDVRRHLAHNPNVPLDLLTHLVATTKIGAVLLPRIATATPAESEELARSRDSTVRMLLAVRRDLPAGIRDALATDPDAKVLKTIAPHPGLSEARLRAMVDRHGVRVLAKAASNPGASGALLEDLTRHRPPVHKAFREIARHPHATPQALLACLAVTDGRSAAAGHPALPPEAVVELLADEDHQVARAAAGNPALPRTVMRQLIRRLMP